MVKKVNFNYSIFTWLDAKNPNFICEHFDIEMKKNNWVRFEGSFQNKKKIGDGIITFSDGSTFRGTFKDDKANGKGVFTSG